MGPSDAELILAARGGDVQSLAVLLMRHRAAMHAVAAAVLGAGPEVEDVVQDASLVAITDLGRIRDPSLARPWLTGITRNLARARLRRHDPLPTDFPDLPAADDPDRRLEEAALRDWIWAAIGGLSEPLRDVVVLRYFSMASSYDAIAAALGIPVGTVRSRLYDARRTLGSRLRELESSAIDGYARASRTSEGMFAAIVDEYNSGTDIGVLRSMLAEEARLTVAASNELIVGRIAITRGMAEDIEAGRT
ncbi:RNA polymerase sigma-70 factor (ECF subfamily) [Kribbella sp. VKM Ac-2527]|uniref:RNA polymerase sigma-70 factor (ECF subfamily) n=1 Tax=Kribbella caucasensis TaxID=2512215 RepID=A0A4R6K6H0_9ACTN|nr:RNA polymerase sigma factor [Kribbella sp. VKM Ac-2527]TDO44520.1 RNA polymerase sigma-70 factor (ECF subfamily) [Kribbella sp. VKM Ac-2527]